MYTFYLIKGKRIGHVTTAIFCRTGTRQNGKNREHDIYFLDNGEQTIAATCHAIRQRITHDDDTRAEFEEERHGRSFECKIMLCKTHFYRILIFVALYGAFKITILATAVISVSIKTKSTKIVKKCRHFSFEKVRGDEYRDFCVNAINAFFVYTGH